LVDEGENARSNSKWVDHSISVNNLPSNVNEKLVSQVYMFKSG
jgi:hypothetical protein